MTLLNALREFAITDSELAQARETIKMEGIGLKSAPEIIGEMTVHKLTSEAIGRCEAYIKLAEIMRMVLTPTVLHTELSPDEQRLFTRMEGARDHLRYIIASSNKEK